MMEIFEFIHLIEIFRLVEISNAQTFLGCENICMNLSHFIYHLIVACSEKRNAAIFTEAHGKCVSDKGSDTRISDCISGNISCE